jgi:hypothetical protein
MFRPPGLPDTANAHEASVFGLDHPAEAEFRRGPPFRQRTANRTFTRFRTPGPDPDPESRSGAEVPTEVAGDEP